MSESAEYFQIALPIPRDEFIALYKQVSHITKLIFAPFGLHEHTGTLLGASKAQEVYTSTYQQIEDAVSKAVFKLQGVDDDQIVASMHEYVGRAQQDEQVMAEITSSLTSLNTLLHPPRVVELPLGVLPPGSEETLSDRVAQCLLRVHAAMQALLAALPSVEMEAIKGSYGFFVPKRVYSADHLMRFCTLPGSGTIMTLFLEALGGLSYEQYLALAGVYHPQLMSRLQAGLPVGDDLPAWLAGAKSPDAQTQSVTPSVDQLFLHPVVSYLLQTSSTSEGAQEQEEGYHRALRALEVLRTVEGMLREEQGEAACTEGLALLQAVLQEVSSLPTALWVEVMLQIACIEGVLHHTRTALEVLGALLARDQHYAKAYSLRGRLIRQHLDEHGSHEGLDEELGVCPTGSDGTLGSGTPLDPAQSFPSAGPLHAIASDTLAGFLLGGSMDLELAGLAEEAVGEVVRDMAKEVYAALVPVPVPAGGAEGAEVPVPGHLPVPAAWYVRTYLTSYALPSIGLYATSPAVPVDPSSSTSEEVEDIDTSSPCPAPPLHLLDGQLKPHDLQAYAIALQLAEQLESFLLLDPDTQIPKAPDSQSPKSPDTQIVQAVPLVAEDVEYALLHGQMGAYVLAAEGIVTEGTLIWDGREEPSPAVVADVDAAAVPEDGAATSAGPSTWLAIWSLIRDHEEVLGVNLSSNGTITGTVPYSPYTPEAVHKEQAAEAEDDGQRAVRPNLYQAMHPLDPAHYEDEDEEDEGEEHGHDAWEEMFAHAEGDDESSEWEDEDEDDEDDAEGDEEDGSVWEDCDSDEQDEDEDDDEDEEDGDEEQGEADGFGVHAGYHPQHHDLDDEDDDDEDENDGSGSSSSSDSNSSEEEQEEDEELAAASATAVPMAMPVSSAPVAIPAPVTSAAPAVSCAAAHQAAPVDEEAAAVSEPVLAAAPLPMEEDSLPTSPTQVPIHNQTQTATATAAAAAAAAASADEEEPVTDAAEEMPRPPTPPPPTTTSSRRIPPISPLLSNALLSRIYCLCATINYLSHAPLSATRGLLEAAIDYDPANGTAYIQLAAIHGEMDARDAAMDILREDSVKGSQMPSPSGSQMPLLMQALFALHTAEIAVQGNHFQESVKHLHTAQRLLPDSIPEPVIEKAHVGYLGVNWLAAYRKRVTQWLLLLRHNLVAMLAVCTYRAHPSAPEQVLYVLQRELDAHPRSSVLLLTLAEIHSQSGDMVTSIKSCSTVSSQEPDNPLPYINTARIFLQLQQPAQAVRHLQAAIALDPAFVLAQVDLGRTLRTLDRLQESMDIFKEALQKARNVAEVRDVLSAQYLSVLQQQIEAKGLYVSVDGRKL